MKPEYVLLFLT